MQISIYDLRMTDPIRIKDHMWALKNNPIACCLWMLAILFCIYSNEYMAAYNRCRWTLYVHSCKQAANTCKFSQWDMHVLYYCLWRYWLVIFSLLYRYGSPILNIKWHQTLNSAESKVISADSRIVRIWDPNTVRLILLEKNKLLIYHFLDILLCLPCQIQHINTVNYEDVPSCMFDISLLSKNVKVFWICRL